MAVPNKSLESLLTQSDLEAPGISSIVAAMGAVLGLLRCVGNPQYNSPNMAVPNKSLHIAQVESLLTQSDLEAPGITCRLTPSALEAARKELHPNELLMPLQTRPPHFDAAVADADRRSGYIAAVHGCSIDETTPAGALEDFKLLVDHFHCIAPGIANMSTVTKACYELMFVGPRLGIYETYAADVSVLATGHLRLYIGREDCLCPIQKGVVALELLKKHPEHFPHAIPMIERIFEIADRCEHAKIKTHSAGGLAPICLRHMGENCGTDVLGGVLHVDVGRPQRYEHQRPSGSGRRYGGVFNDVRCLWSFAVGGVPFRQPTDVVLVRAGAIMRAEAAADGGGLMMAGEVRMHADRCVSRFLHAGGDRPLHAVDNVRVLPERYQLVLDFDAVDVQELNAKLTEFHAADEVVVA